MLYFEICDLNLSFDRWEINIGRQRLQILIFKYLLSVENIEEDIFACCTIFIWLAVEIEDLIILTDMKQEAHFDAFGMWLQEKRPVDSKDIVAVVSVVVFLFTPERNQGVFLCELLLVCLFCELCKD